MALLNMVWTPVTIHEVVADFLQSEQHKFPASDIEMALIDSPDIGDPLQNHKRLRLLYQRRRWLFGEIPPDTKWYNVQSLTDTELDELHVIARCPFDDPNDKNELRKVGARRSEVLQCPPIKWHRPIVWRHDKIGPFTIIEGNHRLIAYASAPSPGGLLINTVVGLSQMPCYFHFDDPPDILMNDLWKR